MVVQSLLDTFHIIYTDDNPGDALIMENCIHKISPLIQLSCFKDGIEFLNYLNKTHTFAQRKESRGQHIIIIDVNMPGLTGYEVIKIIKTHDNEDLHKVPIIMFSGSSRLEDIEKSKFYGAHDYLVKASTYQDTIFILKSFVERWAPLQKTPITYI